MTTPKHDFCWCVTCGARFAYDDVKDAAGCPKCGEEGVPCNADTDVFVEIGWHELRILCIWAENWANHSKKVGDETSQTMPRTVTAIARRLRNQFPEYMPLLLSEEIAGLSSTLNKMGIEHGKIESNVPRPMPLVVNGPGAVGHGKLSKEAIHNRPWHSLLRTEDHAE